MQRVLLRDFVAVYDEALAADLCYQITQMQQRDPQRQAGRTGHGVDPEKKTSVDLSLTGQANWQVVDQHLRSTAFAALCDYLQAWPSALIGGVAAQLPDPVSGRPVTVTLENWPQLGAPNVGRLAQTILRCGTINLQHYPAGRGHYGYWHHEQFPKDAQAEPLHRVLFFIFYLNDVAEGGATEFLHLDLAVQPKVGRLVLAPAGFTHTHRGTVPLSGDKFVATSWVLYQRAEALYGESAAPV